MKERTYYILALAAFVVAIAVLVVVIQRAQPTNGQTEPTTFDASNDYHALFTILKTRMDSDALFEFRIRHNAFQDVVTISQTGTRLVEAADDYFCLSNTDTAERFCYPYSQLLVVAIPE